MKRIKQYIADKKEQNRLQNEAQLRAEFKVVERDGYLWLTHQGVAFMKFDEHTASDDIVGQLYESRGFAVEFEKL